MAPETKLLWWVAWIVVPFATLGAMIPAALPWCAPPVLLLAIAVTWDAVRARSYGGALGVDLPSSVRLSVGLPGRMEVVVSSGDGLARRLRLRLDWPEGVRPKPEEMPVDWPAGSPRIRLSWPCTGWRRGRGRVTACYLEIHSPWGFWAVRRVIPQACEFQTHPNLLAERQRVSPVFLTRGGVGSHPHRLVGKGREFERLREYLPGDAYEDVHWKATAKRGRPVTKLFQMERTQEVYVLLDTSRLSGRAAGGSVSGTLPPAATLAGDSSLVQRDDATPALERFVTAGLVLALATEQEGDRFGLLTFADRVQGFLRASNGRAHFNRCRDHLLGVECREVTPDFDELFALVRTRLRHRSLVVILTALDDPVLAEAFGRGVELVSRQHVVLVNQLSLPGVEPLFRGAKVSSEAGLYNRLAGHLRWHGLRELQGRLSRQGVCFGWLDQERLSADLVAQYLDVKQRQRL